MHVYFPEGEVLQGVQEKYAAMGMPLACGSMDVTHWSEWLESVRKDIECCFGILKQRFRFLMNSIPYHSFYLIQNAFRTACILHNMLLDYDKVSGGYSSILDWATVHPDLDDDSFETTGYDEHINDNNAVIIEPIHATTTLVGKTYHPMAPYGHEQLTTALVTHFYHNYRLGLVKSGLIILP